MHLKICNNYLIYENLAKIFEKNINDNNNEILICEHNDIYTYGKGCDNQNNINIINHIPVTKTNRGGNWTYHGPGQIMCYFTLNVKSLNFEKNKLILFVDFLEQSIIKFLNSYFHIQAMQNNLNRGVWIQENNKNYKIAFIGLNISKSFITHGFGLNISNKIENFKYIIPCESGINVISVENILNQKIDLKTCKKDLGLFLLDQITKCLL